MQRQSWTLFFIVCLLAGAIGVVNAQDLARVSDDGTTTLTGALSVIYGDPLPGSDAETRVDVVLEPSIDQSILLNMPVSAAQPFHAQQVSVTGEFSPLSPPASSGIDAVFNVTSLDRVALAGTSDVRAPQDVLGNQPWVNLLCRFSDYNDEPRTPAQIQQFFGNTEPGLNHYWKQLSYNQINIDGTFTSNQWRSLPQPRSFYWEPGDPRPNLDAMMEDCVELFDADIDFSDKVGINAFFNASFGCCAWGGSKFLTLDGQTRIFRTTWNPPNGVTHGVIAHEMGHGWGFPHSSGPSDNPPSGLSIYVSEWDVMSDASGDSENFDSALFKSIAPGTIAEYLHDVGWIPESRRVVVNDGQETTVTLERTQLPTSNSSILMVEIPIDNSSIDSYTVEARKENSYDINTPDPAVVIHRIIENYTTDNTGPALVVDADDGNDNVNDAGAKWLPGETFVDAANNIEIEVLSSTATTYTVRINNDAAPQPQEVLQNGNLNNNMNFWSPFGDVNYVYTNGGINFHRQSPGWGGATIFQSVPTVNLSAGEPIVASIDLQNLSGVPKGVEVVFRTQNFSEQIACSVTLPPQSGVQTITMRDVLSTSWSNALFAVRALDPDGIPNVRMDNASVQYLEGNTAITGYSCSGDVTGNYENLLNNGNFSTGLRYWIMYGDYQFAINNGILTFYRTSSATRPAVAFNNGAHYIPTGSKLQLQVRIGNTSSSAKNINVVVRDQFWSQQMSCSYTVPANTPLTTVTLKGTAVKNWANPMVLIRNLSADGAPNLLVDDANLQIRPAMTIDSNCGNPFGGATVTDGAKSPATILPDGGIMPDSDGAAPAPVAPPNPDGIPEIPGF